MYKTLIYLNQAGYDLNLKENDDAKFEPHEIRQCKSEPSTSQGNNLPDNLSLSSKGNRVVRIGSRVTISMDFDGVPEEDTFKLVDNAPVGIFAEEVSIDSPLGSAILGKTVGTTVKYKVDKNVLVARITKVE